MADWLNVTLAGPYSLTLTRDGVPVDPESVGAELTVDNGVITLETPSETHIWEVIVTPSLPPSLFRMKDFSFTETLDAASAIAGSVATSLDLGPPVGPDPCELSGYATTATLSLTELA